MDLQFDRPLTRFPRDRSLCTIKAVVVQIQYSVLYTRSSVLPQSVLKETICTLLAYLSAESKFDGAITKEDGSEFAFVAMIAFLCF